MRLQILVRAWCRCNFYHVINTIASYIFRPLPRRKARGIYLLNSMGKHGLSLGFLKHRCEAMQSSEEQEFQLLVLLFLPRHILMLFKCWEPYSTTGLTRYYPGQFIAASESNGWLTMCTNWSQLQQTTKYQHAIVAISLQINIRGTLDSIWSSRNIIFSC